MKEIELEKTYLAKYLPDGMDRCDHKEIVDIYLPASSVHPVLRIRRNGDRYEMTKKSPVSEGDASEQAEHTIPLSADEFEALSRIEGKRVSKVRHYYVLDGRTAEIDVFQDDLAGLVLADFEFRNREDKDAFEMPDFCLADVTQELFLAGGMLCGKKYADIAKELERFGYNEIIRSI